MKKLVLVFLSIFAFALSFVPQFSKADNTQYSFSWADRQTITSPSFGNFILDNVGGTQAGNGVDSTSSGSQTLTFTRQNDPDNCPDTIVISINNTSSTDWSSGSYVFNQGAPFGPNNSTCQFVPRGISVNNGGNNYNVLDWIDSATIRPLPQAASDLYGQTGDFVLDPTTNQFIQQGSGACHSYIDNVNSSHTGGALHLALDSNTKLDVKNNFVLFQNCYQFKDGVTITKVITGSQSHTIQNNILAVSLGNPANFATAGTPSTNPNAGTGAAASDPCADQLGAYAWVGCPAYNKSETFLTGIYDNFIAKYFLAIDPLTTNPQLKKVVEVITSVANVFFIIVFLIMIFGTTMNVSSYTVKRTLPRLIIAAIAIQFSFFICGVIVDIGNILGAGILDLVGSTFNVTDPQSSGSVTNFLIVGGGVVGVGGLIAAGVILGPAVVLIALSLVLAVFAFIFTLLIRKVIITMLIIAAPLAFAAAVLPNTEQYFKKWYQTLIRIVMVYPIISVILCAGFIAKTAAMSSTGVASNGGVAAVIGSIISIAAFFMMPMAFKWGGSAMGIASRIGSKYSGAEAGRAASMKAGTAPVKDAYKGIKANRQAVRMEGFNDSFGNSGITGLKSMRAGLRLGKGFGDKYTSGGTDRYDAAQRAASASSRNRQESAEQEEKKAAERTIRDLPMLDGAGMPRMNTTDPANPKPMTKGDVILDSASAPGASTALQAAAIDSLANSGDTANLEKLKKHMSKPVSGSSGPNHAGAAAFNKALGASSGATKVREKAPHIAGGNYNNMSPARLAKLDKVGAQAMLDHMKTLNDTRIAGTAVGATTKAVADGIEAEGHINAFSSSVGSLTIDQKGDIGPEVVRLIGNGLDSSGNAAFDPSVETYVKSKIDSTGNRFA